MVFEILYLFNGLMEKDKVVMLKEYENKFVIVCN